MVFDFTPQTFQNSSFLLEEKSYRCPKFDGDAKQTLEIRVERKRNNRSTTIGVTIGIGITIGVTLQNLLYFPPKLGSRMYMILLLKTQSEPSYYET